MVAMGKNLSQSGTQATANVLLDFFKNHHQSLGVPNCINGCKVISCKGPILRHDWN